MPRKLKTYQTSIGFFDLAVAAPSMKSALEIWGADSNLFHQGFAKETDDPAVVSATMAVPGVVLRRPVGTDAEFGETSALPKDLLKKSAKTAPRRQTQPGAKANKSHAPKSAATFEQQQRKREAAQRREELALAKERERKAARVARAQTALDNAERDHDARKAAIQAERDAIGRRADKETGRWERERERLSAAVDKAKNNEP